MQTKTYLNLSIHNIFDIMVDKFKLTEENIYAEYYGVDFKKLKEFSDLCQANGMIFCDCILGKVKDWEYFKRYMKKRYNISSYLMNHDMGFGLIGLNSPTTNVEKYQKNLEKIKKIGGRLYELQQEIQNKYEEVAKMRDIFIHSF